jgi:hypothetical protein
MPTGEANRWSHARLLPDPCAHAASTGAKTPPKQTGECEPGTVTNPKGNPAAKMSKRGGVPDPGRLRDVRGINKLSSAAPKGKPRRATAVPGGGVHGPV